MNVIDNEQQRAWMASLAQFSLLSAGTEAMLLLA